MIRFSSLLIIILLSTPPVWAQTASVQKEHTKATLVSDLVGVARGKSLTVAVLLEPQPGWHTYWENPGDAGMPTTLKWKLPAGFSAGEIDWPAPHYLMEGPLATYAYDGNVFLPVTITAPLALVDPSYPITVRADWLVCKDICVPESAELTLNLPTLFDPMPTQDAPLFAEHAKHRPQPLKGTYSATDRNLLLSLPLGEKNIREVRFFPRQSDVIANAAEQPFEADGARLIVTVPRANDKPVERLHGIVTLTTPEGKRHYDVTFSLTSIPVAEHTPQDIFFPLILLSALIGGLILNLMPCVLPVLSLKALAVVKKAGHDHKTVVRMGVAYTLGILVSFAIIAGLLIALQKSGEAIGWGYQMQSPAFVGFLVYLLFLIGLNLSGLFHLPVLFGRAAHDIDDTTSARGSFLTGVLATAVATPCTAPFMASAVGVALTLPPLQALLVFEMLGLGLALPFLLISLFPALRRFLPKPGAWMETFKKWLAVPMYASVLWLLWVLALQTGLSGLFIALGGMVIILLALRWKRALLPVALLLLASLPLLSQLEFSPSETMMEEVKTMGVDTVEFSEEKLKELLLMKKPVFIDATAAWCITCQVNARVAIHRERTLEAFKKHGITLMIADWTLRNDEITAFLSRFGYKGVPLYVFYPGGGEPVVLPQLLTEDIVIDAITPKGD